MKAELNAVIHELRQLRQEGVQDVYVQDSTMELLRSVAEKVSEESSDNVEIAPMEEAVTEPGVPDSPEIILSGSSKKEKMENLRKTIGEDSFALSQLRSGKKLVPGIGSLDADIFFCGEAPGAEEEIRGEPFVGPAGELLTKIIHAMGLARETVYIGNIMTYRPPLPTEYGNRPPTQEEINYCLPYLKAQLAIVKPKVIVALGKTAVDGLLGADKQRAMSRIRGQWFSFEGIPLLPTFHPSYVLRNGSKAVKKQVWDDMLTVLEKAGLPLPA